MCCNDSCLPVLVSQHSFALFMCCQQTGSLQKTGAAVAAVARSLGTGSIVVNATGGVGSNSNFGSINKRVNQAVVQGAAIAQSIPTVGILGKSSDYVMQGFTDNIS